MAEKNSSNSANSWLVPIVVAGIGAISTIAVAWINRPVSKSSEPQPAVESSSSPSQRGPSSLPPSVTGSMEQPVRLSSDQVKALLIGKIEQGRIIEPTIASLEGNPGTWYEAYYDDNNTMLYRRAASEVGAERWTWFVNENGTLCRGPGPTSSEMFCRTIESVGDDAYRGVGFRSGTPRYEFTVEFGNAEALQ